MIRDTIEYLGQGLDMVEDHAYQAMYGIMEGKWTPSQIAGFLMALKIKGETVDEISGFVRAMREKALKIQVEDSVDTCGTGGDGLHSFNVSTAAAFVTAAAGVSVAKHGNRSVSSKSGSADVLTTLGVNIELTPQQAGQCLREIGMAFLFAPIYHASMKHAVVPRRELGVRTVFNILGPMCNPAMIKKQVVGAFNLDVAEKMVRVLQKTGSKHVLLVHSDDGMDEIAISDRTTVFELKDGIIETYQIEPEQFGMQKTDVKSIQGDGPSENAEIMKSIFNRQAGPIADITALNAGAAIYVGGAAASLEEGVKIALEQLRSGKVLKKLNELIAFTNSLN